MSYIRQTFVQFILEMLMLEFICLVKFTIVNCHLRLDLLIPNVVCHGFRNVMVNYKLTCVESNCIVLTYLFLIYYDSKIENALK